MEHFDLIVIGSGPTGEKGAAQATYFISVSWSLINGKVEVKVKDNGSGIPDSIREKIFQPFFTTKPAGQGTGLGSSLSYDIVKARGGDIRLEARDSRGSEFIIQLPHT